MSEKLPSQPVLVIFSGLPGTGKSSLANRLARALRWPILRLDDLVVDVPAHADHHFWDEKILSLLCLAEAQLELGISVVVDSVFMNKDRYHAQEIARERGADFRPVYCFVSDEAIWEGRVTHRAEQLQNPAVATWEGIQHQRRGFATWKPNTALFVDSVQPIEQNYARVLDFVSGAGIQLEPILMEEPFIKGKYHE